MKGIILAGGEGSRLRPLTLGVSKQLLPVYDKPMVHYPLSVLMLAGIKEIMLICTRDDLAAFKKILGNGERFGISIQFEIQSDPNGIAEAFLIAEEFIGDSDVCLILGDNIFYGPNFGPVLRRLSQSNSGATIFGYQVKDPERFGVIEVDENNIALSIEEKPRTPKSNYAITGLYFYDNRVVEYAKQNKPSERGELEISMINQFYLEQGELSVEFLGRGFTWLDTGTHESLVAATNFVRSIEYHQGFKIACLEEIALSNTWISKSDLENSIILHEKTNYGDYLRTLIRKE
jgi:glucose-1-phosphate thymidylyltransferase